MKVILTGFDGKENSAKLLLNAVNTTAHKIILPNNKMESVRIISQIISNGQYIFLVGQKPLLKDKICIELQASIEMNTIKTTFPFEKIEQYLKGNYCYKYSTNAGTSFCNHLYFNVLKHIHDNNFCTKAVFIHIPQRKNITDFKKMCRVFEYILDSQLLTFSS